MRATNFRNVRHVIGSFRWFLCVVLSGIILLGAADGAIAATAGNPPDIKAFSADPMTLKDGGFAVYTFAVQGATNIQLIEAGDVIKEVKGPASSNYKGTAKGRTTNQIRTGGSNTFDAFLVASNSGGTKRSKLTLSFATLIPPKSVALIPPVSENMSTSRTEKPEWLPQTPTSPGPTAYKPSGRQTPPSEYPPGFATCPKGCDYCLTAGDAATRGITQRCTDKPCYFSPDKQENWYCYSAPAKVWCCKDGRVFESTKEECDKAGGSGYATEAEAIKACQQVIGWFCSGDKVYQGSRTQAAEVKATWYATEAEAIKACQQVIGWFCSGDKVYQGSRTQAAEVKATWYTTEAEATRACQPVLGWYCSGGRVYQGSRTQAAEVKAAWYTTEAEATRACQPVLGWYCSGGRVYQGSRTQAAEVKATWYTTEAEATRVCQQQAMCWCCAQGKVYQTTQTQCAQYGGNCYSSQTEATRYCQQQSMCWCCAQGKVYQATQTQCAQYGGNCYSSQTEATRYCQQASSCWCCAGGKVYQSTQTQCSQARGTCFGSQTEASRSCQQYYLK